MAILDKNDIFGENIGKYTERDVMVCNFYIQIIMGMFQYISLTVFIVIINFFLMVP